MDVGPAVARLCLGVAARLDHRFAGILEHVARHRHVDVADRLARAHDRGARALGRARDLAHLVERAPRRDSPRSAHASTQATPSASGEVAAARVQEPVAHGR